MSDDRVCPDCGERRSLYPVTQALRSVTEESQRRGSVRGSLSTGGAGGSGSVGGSGRYQRSLEIVSEYRCDNLACSEGHGIVKQVLGEYSEKLRKLNENDRSWDDVEQYEGRAAVKAAEAVETTTNDVEKGRSDLDPERIEEVIPDGFAERIERARPGRLGELMSRVRNEEDARRRVEEVKNVQAEIEGATETLAEIERQRRERDRTETQSAWERHRSHERSEGHGRSR